MTDLSDLLLPETVLERLAAANKKSLFQQLATAAAAAYGLDSAAVAEGLVKREKLGSTGFGSGVATPHARIAGLNHVVGVFARLAQPIDFQAVGRSAGRHRLHAAVAGRCRRAAPEGAGQGLAPAARAWLCRQAARAPGRAMRSTRLLTADEARDAA